MKKGMGWEKKIKLLLVVILAVAFAFAVYSTFFGPKPCSTFECFQKAMKNCEKTSYVNEEQIASWKYSILGRSGDSCTVNVMLLQAKEGNLELNDYLGEDMVCSYSLGFTGYPEGDLNSCHGLLKEGLQEIIINKLHIYIINNLGKIEEAQNAIN